jgi:hypothetical protein
MDYRVFMEKVLAGRSVNATAKALGIPQKTLEGYVKERSFPGCAMTIKLAEAAGISVQEAVDAVAKRESQVRPRLAFAAPQFATAGLAAVIVVVTNFLTPSPAEAAPRLASSQVEVTSNFSYVKF